MKPHSTLYKTKKIEKKTYKSKKQLLHELLDLDSNNQMQYELAIKPKSTQEYIKNKDKYYDQNKIKNQQQKLSKMQNKEDKPSKQRLKDKIKTQEQIQNVNENISKRQQQKNEKQKEQNLQLSMPMRFHPKYRDKIESTGFGQCTQTEISGYKGFVALDFKLTKKTQWQFIFNELSYEVNLGVCQIPNDLQEGTVGWKSINIIGFDQQVGDFNFCQKNLVKLTYYPSGFLEYFNTNTKKLQIEIITQTRRLLILSNCKYIQSNRNFMESPTNRI